MGKTTTSKGSNSKGSRFAGFLWPGHLDECCLGNEDDAPNLPVWKLTSLKSLVHSVGPKSQVGPDLIRPQKFRQLLEGCLSSNLSIGFFHCSLLVKFKNGKRCASKMRTSADVFGPVSGYSNRSSSRAVHQIGGSDSLIPEGNWNGGLHISTNPRVSSRHYLSLSAISVLEVLKVVFGGAEPGPTPPGSEQSPGSHYGCSPWLSLSRSAL